MTNHDFQRRKKKRKKKKKKRKRKKRKRRKKRKKRKRVRRGWSVGKSGNEGKLDFGLRSFGG